MSYFRNKVVNFCLVIILLGCLSVKAQTVFDGNTLNVEIVPECLAVSPGQKTIKLGINFQLKPNYHIYYKNPGDIGKPTTITWMPQPNYTVEALPWPQPTTFLDSGFKTIGYENQVFIPFIIKLKPNYKIGDKLYFKARITWLACKNSCMPGSADLKLDLPVLANSPMNQRYSKFTNSQINTIPTEHISTPIVKADPINANNKFDFFKIFSILGFALIGGLILNFMPCVLPVVALKVLSFVEEAQSNKTQIRNQGLVFSLGIWVSFAVLSFVIILLQILGNNIGWGFQFQSPLFLIFMICLIVILSLSLFGIFYIDIPLPTTSLNKLSDNKGYLGTFFNGVLATCLSTPCTAPFLGSALGFAFAQIWYISLLIFMTIGLGMSVPYLLIAVNPQLIKFIPKPGLWMDTLKQSMGFIMLFTAIWLMSVLVVQIDLTMFINFLFFINTLALVIFLQSKTINLNSSNQKKLAVNTIMISLIALSFYLLVYPTLSAKPKSNKSEIAFQPDKINWISYNKNLLDDLMQGNDILFYDFTAKWCLTCQANERLVLENPDVVKSFKQNKVIALKFDWTLANPEITNMLKKFGRSGVPLYVIYSPYDRLKPVILPEIITPEIVIEAINNIKQSQNVGENK